MSLNLCGLLLVIGATHGRQAALISSYAPINQMRLLWHPGNLRSISREGVL